jgi:hypothetical protein
MRWVDIDERPLTKQERQKAYKWNKLKHDAVKEYTHAEMLAQYALWVAQAKRKQEAEQELHRQQNEQQIKALFSI